MNQKQIAETLGLSRATVCLALADSHKIKTETKEKVKALAAKVGYRPNLLARSLSVNKTFSVGVVFPDASCSFFGELAQEICHCLREAGYLGIFFSPRDSKEYSEIINEIISRNIDGLISFAMNVEELFKIQETSLPVVLYHKGGNYPISCVDVDRYSGGYKATKHLIDQGCKNIAYVGGGCNSEPRFSGYKSALMEAGLPLNSDLTEPGGDVAEPAYKAMKKILERRRPDGVFAFNDDVAIGVVRAITDAGLKVPNDIAVIGFDNIRQGAFLTPSLSTIEQPRNLIARELVSILVDQMENKNNKMPVCKVLETELIVRESSIYCSGN
jgi:DNA-binding LacI/PurR family transcriptional regulator